MYNVRIPGVSGTRKPSDGEPEGLATESETGQTETLKGLAQAAVKEAKLAIYMAQAAVAEAIAEGELEACSCYTMHFGSAQVDMERIEAEMSGEAAVEQKRTTQKTEVQRFLESLRGMASVEITS